MAQVWAIVILGVLLALIAAAVFAWSRSRPRHAVIGIGIGAICGLAGAFLIINQQMDVVPDTAEGVLVSAIIVVVSLVLITLTWLRVTGG
jgi:hypothetical protein